MRVREDVRGDLMRSRHRVSKLLLRQGIVYYGGHPWTVPHEVWLRGQRFTAPGLQVAYDEALETVPLTAAQQLSSPRWCGGCEQLMRWSITPILGDSS